MGQVCKFPIVPRTRPEIRSRLALLSAGVDLRAQMAMFAQRAIALDETDYAIRKLEMDCAEIVQFLVRNHKESSNE